MPSPGAQSLHLYRTNTKKDIGTALAQLLDAKSTMLATGIPLIEKMYSRIDLLAVTYALQTPDNMVVRIAQEMIGFLDPQLVTAVIDEPENEFYRDALSLQLIMIATATGNNPRPDFTPYTVEEFGTILLGDVLYYDDIYFIRTLQSVIEGIGNDAYSILLASTLSPIQNEFDDVKKGYEWDDAFMFALMLQVVWKAFIFLDRDQQERLLQNYFYSAIVVGVPVRQWLSEMAHAEGVNPKVFFDVINRSLQNNRETLPTNTAVTEGRLFVDVAKEFLSAVYSENIDTLAEVHFVESWYVGEEHREVFTGWLREAMTIMLHCKKGDL